VTFRELEARGISLSTVERVRWLGRGGEVDPSEQGADRWRDEPTREEEARMERAA
jgi:hypothetical protein